MTVHVTEHAIDRYCERVANVPRRTARQLMMAAERSIECAAAFGAHTVRLGNGAKLVITGLADIRIVTVLQRGHINWADLPPDERRRRSFIARCGTAARPANDQHSGARGSITSVGKAQSAPVCCGNCGMRAGHPIARACVRTDCPLANRCVDGEPS